MCITGEAPNRAIQEIAKNMNVSRSQAGRLVMTESAAFAGRARADCMKSLGVEEFEVVESLDHITCDYCQSMDGKHFPMGDFQIGVTAPPFHPNCRGCTCPYFDDEFTTGEERAARGDDGKVYYVQSDMTYEEWEKSFVDSGKTGSKETDTRTFMQKKDAIYENEKQIDRLHNQKKEEELRMLTSSSISEIETAQKNALSIEKQIEDLKTENKKLQESLGLPTNAKERFHVQAIDYDSLPHDVNGNDELSAIGAWTRTDYTFINNYLRNDNKGVRPESIQNAKILETMIERNVVQEQFTVKRGTDYVALNRLFGSDKWKNPGYNVSGKIITDKVFFATTPDKNGGFSGIQMYIDVPKGTKGVYIGDLSAAPDEKEFLLQCNTKFSIEKIETYIDKFGDTQYDIYMKVIVDGE